MLDERTVAGLVRMKSVKVSIGSSRGLGLGSGSPVNLALATAEPEDGDGTATDGVEETKSTDKSTDPDLGVDPSRLTIDHSGRNHDEVCWVTGVFGVGCWVFGYGDVTLGWLPTCPTTVPPSPPPPPPPPPPLPSP